MIPRLDAFHSSDGAGKTGVTYWKKTYLDMDYCEAQNGYVCQRPAAAGSEPFNKGFQSFTKLLTFSNQGLQSNLS